MRIRTIKPEFFTHEELFELEKETGLPVRVAFAGLWCAADKEGRFKWEPRRLGVQILPYDSVDFSRVLDALVTRGFVRKYASNGGSYGWIPSFTVHQIINNREKASELPEPLLEADSDACGTREPRVDHAGKEEGKGKEGKGISTTRSAPVVDVDSVSRHRAITAQIGKLYQEATGKVFECNGKFLAALKRFLNDWPGTADEFLDRYWDALCLREEKYAHRCRAACDPAILCQTWAIVEAEIASLRKQETQRPVFSKLI